ncbi:DUF3137 domain-containing protein [Mycoplasmatota bacterium WC44]
MYDFEYFINKRNKTLKMFMLPAAISIVIGIVIFIATNSINGNPSAIIPFFALGVVFFGIGAGQMKKLSNEFKEKYLVELLKKNFTNVNFNASGGLTREDVRQSELLPRTDRFYSNDLITGEYLDVKFKISDLHLQEVRRNGKNTQIVTVYKGPFMEFDFNKDFMGKVQVRERGKSTLFSDYEKISMESVVFNKVFKVYATRAHAAFYILTPHLMEKLMELEKQRPGNFYFSFIEGRMYIALDNRRDNFEVGMFGKIDQSIVDTFESQLSIIKDIINEMKLNENF